MIQAKVLIDPPLFDARHRSHVTRHFSGLGGFSAFLDICELQVDRGSRPSATLVTGHMSLVTFLVSRVGQRSELGSRDVDGQTREGEQSG